jgi:DNA-binding response OmpR family regulator
MLFLFLLRVKLFVLTIFGMFLLQCTMHNEALANHQTKKRILVVDDEHDITLTLQIGLEEDGGFDVDAFTNPERAISCFKPDLYDLVLIDIKMPKMDGFVLYKRLKTVDPDVKVCFLTTSEMYREDIR